MPTPQPARTPRAVAPVAFGLAAIAALPALATLPGCSAFPSGGTREIPAGRSRDDADRARQKYADPVARSALRERALGVLEAAAVSERPAVRANAVEAIGGYSTRGEPVVAAALKDENLGVRAVAVTVVGKHRLAGLVPSVRPLLQDPSPFVSSAARFALARNGEDVDQTPFADLLLTHPDPKVRAHVAFLLGELGNPSAVGLLKDASARRIPRVGDSQLRILRLQIAEAMVKLGDHEQIEPIRAALFPASPEELEAAALAVQIIGEVGDIDASLDDQLMWLTAMMDEKGRPMPAEIRLAAAGALPKLGKYDMSFIADTYVSSENPAIRAQSAYVFGQARKVENLAVLEHLLGDPDEAVRVAAAAAILETLEPVGR